MSSVKDTASFFARGNSAQFEHVLALYPQVLKLKAENKCKKPDELIRLDDWYQNKLPQLIKKRGKDLHMVHEELVKTMKWKQTRGKFYPQLSYLIKVNTPRAVQAETRKAFRKLPNLEQAITALSNLKGVGTTMASALLAAAAPETAPFMADECLMAIPEIEGIDYTTREYMNFVQHIQVTTDRLNRECHPVALLTDDIAPEHPGSAGSKTSKTTGNNGTSASNDDAEDDSSRSSDENSSSRATLASKKKLDTSSTALKAAERKWSPHKVELALWTHYVASELQPELLENIPEDGPVCGATDGISSSTAAELDSASTTNGNSIKVPTEESNHTLEEPSDESNCGTERITDDSSKDQKFALDSLDECTKSEDSMERPSSTTTTSSRHAANNNRSATTVPSDDSLSSPSKRSKEAKVSNSEEEAQEDDEETPPPGKKSKFG